MIRFNSFKTWGVLISFVLMAMYSKTRNTSTIAAVDHIYLSTDEAEGVFRVLKEDLELPVVWDYEDWGTFKSGGVSLGNTVLEIKEKTADDPSGYGVALRPYGGLEAIGSKLTALDVPVGSVTSATDWRLQDILPASSGGHVFLCDYNDPRKVAKQRIEREQELSKQGNPLGIVEMRSITLSQDKLDDLCALAELDKVSKGDQNLSFSRGPQIKFADAESGMPVIAMKVKDLQIARDKLLEIGQHPVHIGKEEVVTSETLNCVFLFSEE